MRSWRRAAREVSVRQWPCGALPISRWPRGPQPRSGAMLVFAQVSSMKTKRLGSMLAWRARHLQRRLATSGRSCSAAKAVFFEAEPLGVEEIPHRLPAHLDTPPCQLATPFLDLAVRPFRHPRLTLPPVRPPPPRPLTPHPHP